MAGDRPGRASAHLAVAVVVIALSAALGILAPVVGPVPLTGPRVPVASAQGPPLLIAEWDFDSDAGDWKSAVPGASVERVADGGAGALEVTSTGGTVSVFTVWPGIEAGATYELAAWIRSDGDVEDVVIKLALRADSVADVAVREAPAVTPGAAYAPVRVKVADTSFSAHTAWLSIAAQVHEVGAKLLIDRVELRQIAPPPAATPSGTATSTSTATATPSASPTATASPTRSPTPIVTPASFQTLTNGDFEHPLPLFGWSNQGGNAYLSDGYVGSDRVAVLHSSTTATKWLQQAVSATPLGWYEAGAALATLSEGDAAWIRVAWYASVDGSGTQLSVEDSPVVSGGEASVLVGPVEAPAEAHSARVRLMLRPASGAFTLLAADLVTFVQVPAPLRTPTPTPSPTPTPPPTAAPTPPVPGLSRTAPPEPSTPAAGVLAGPAPQVAALAPSGGRARGGGPSSLVSAEVSAGTGSIRVTEVYPDPLEAGLDAPFEWVEIANVGAATASLAGLRLVDNAGSVQLPALTLPPGATLILGGRDADTAQAVLVRLLPGGISNGLANGGDRLELVTADGRLLDALSYGSDRTHADGPALPALGAGHSIQRLFADDGSLAGAAISDVPSPGRIEVVGGLPSGVAGAGGARASGVSDRMTWMVLGGGASALLLAAAARRARTVLASERREG